MFSSEEVEGILLAIVDHDEQSAEVDVGTREHDVDCAPLRSFRSMPAESILTLS